MKFIYKIFLHRWIKSRDESNDAKSPNYTIKLSQKSYFQPSTIKPDNICHPTIETMQI